MLTTEDEASKKWCPEARYGATSDDQNASNRWETWYTSPEGVARIAGPLLCIGSKCMAWRWAMAQNSVDGSDNLTKFQTHGYCGKAGNAVPFK